MDTLSDQSSTNPPNPAACFAKLVAAVYAISWVVQSSGATASEKSGSINWLFCHFVIWLVLFIQFQPFLSQC